MEDERRDFGDKVKKLNEMMSDLDSSRLGTEA